MSVRYTWAFWIIAGFLSGTIARSESMIEIELGWLCGLLAVAVGCWLVATRQRGMVWFLPWVLLGLMLGIWRTDWTLERFVEARSSLQHQVGDEVFLTGILVAEPDVRESITRYQLQIDTESGPLRVLLNQAPYPSYHYGDRLEVRGQLQPIENFTSDTGREFKYQMFLAKDNIGYQIWRAEVKVVASNQGSAIRSALFAVKRAFINNLNQVIPEPESALAGGILLGERRALGEELSEAFRVAGVIHIVVLSGYNVTIIVEGLRSSLRWLPLLYQLSVSGVLVVLFALMTGGGATIVRATIMGLLGALALATGNRYAITRALVLAAFLMLLWNPLLLLYDPSFQLSFLATLGLIYFSPVVDRWLRFVPNWLQIRTFAAATIGTQIMVLPLLLYQVGQLSLVAVPANMLVLIATPWAMLFSFLTGLAGFINGVLAQAISFFAFGLLAYQINIATWLAALPGAAVTIEHFSLSATLVVYALLIVIVFRMCRVYTPKHKLETRLKTKSTDA